MCVDEMKMRKTYLDGSTGGVLQTSNQELYILAPHALDAILLAASVLVVFVSHIDGVGLVFMFVLLGDICVDVRR
jgi:hypothetical protein